MEPELSRSLVIGVAIMAALVIVQTLITSVLLAATVRRLGSLCQDLTRTSQRLQTTIRLVHDRLEDMLPVLTTVSRLSGQVSGQSDTVRESVRAIEEKTVRNLEVMREGVQGAASRMDRALNRISTETYRIHRSIIAPARHVSALIHAGRSMVERWFGRDRPPTDVYTTDEDIFI